MFIYEGNKYIFQRLKGIQDNLSSIHTASKSTSSNTKGKEREEFINLFLSKILPSHFRFGSGEITDLSSHLSGQLDIVIEYPLLQSITLPASNAGNRLYLAEGVAACIEVKSNLITQWNEVKETSQKVKQLRRRLSASTGMAPKQIPLFAVGYKGWKNAQSLNKRIQEGIVDGILIIEEGLFVWNHGILPVSQLSGTATGPWALWGLIVALNRLATSLKYTSIDLIFYARPDWMIIKRLCNKLEEDDSVEVNFLEILHEEGIKDHEEANKILKSLEEEGFIKIISTDMSQDTKINADVNIKITSEAIEFTKYMNTPFELT